ncbi:hypothetical protein DCC85_07255 [Paenibacillus sp. CAA11]|uniref:hypothetical protein n=1 Tax=Paenibacillus sp. CAA11 TaxID=1532905 RepID=UPI000D36A0D7|nr:hypothetical protein [Paenibacillus sp. CAA11]AWB44032.1 hypothetical protein DCC85_07255 [Paenibacillus sp. CAA11]
MLTLRKKDITLFIVLTCLFSVYYIFQAYLHKQDEFNELSNELYTSHHEVIINKGNNPWLKDLDPSLNYRVFAEFDDNYRILLKNTEDWSPPMISGYFFGEKDQGLKAVVGKEMSQQVYERGKVSYISFHGEEYEVTGVMGASFASSIDYLVILSNPNFSLSKDDNPRIIIDSDSKNTVKEIVSRIMNNNPLVTHIESVQKGVARTSEVSFFNLLLYFEIYILLLFTTIAFIRYWYEIQRKEVYVLILLGISKRKILQQMFTKSLLIVLLSSSVTILGISIFNMNLKIDQVILLIFIFLVTIWLLLSIFFYKDYAVRKVVRE